MLPHMQSSFQRKAGSGHACAGCIHCRKLRKPLRKAGKCLRHTGCCASWLEVRIRTSPRIPGQVGCIRPSSPRLLPSDICQSSDCMLQGIPGRLWCIPRIQISRNTLLFLRFPFVVPALKSGKHAKNCCTGCTAVFGYSARPWWIRSRFSFIIL